MKYTTGDIWRLAESNKTWVVIPTNTTIRKDGLAVMGMGIAKEAAIRHPKLQKDLAEHIDIFGDILFCQYPIICMPIQHDWKQPAQLSWVERSCLELEKFSNNLHAIGYHRPIYIPRIDFDLSGLDWERELRPVIDSLLTDDRFVLVKNYE